MKASVAIRRVAAAVVGTVASSSLSAAAIGLVLATDRLRTKPRAGHPIPAILRDAALTVVPAVAVGIVDDSDLGRAKHRFRLRVVSWNGSHPRLSQLLVRNAVKYAPWQLAHLGVRQQSTRIGGRFGDALGMACMFGALSAAGVNVWTMFRNNSTLHDLAARTRVEAADGGTDLQYR